MTAKLRVATVFGTRPEAIKMAPVVRALAACDGIEQRVVVTGQHREMLDQVLDLFGIAPDDDLGLMAANQSLASLTARAIEGLDAVFAGWRPDLTLVQGDTTTSFCAALAAFYRGSAVGHVEAGLRTGDLRAPWPEEANRQLTGRLADLHFAPTEGARQNLLAEGVPGERIEVTGNTVIDALQWVAERAQAALAREGLGIREVLGLQAGADAESTRVASAFEAVRRGARRLVLVTGHRRESFGAGFQRICDALLGLARRYPDVVFAYPVHLNPNVRDLVHERLGGQPNVLLLPPLPYLPFVTLMSLSHVVLTDSGGIQEEAPGLGKPVLCMREVTERPEGVAAGTVRLVGTDVGAIDAGVRELLDDPAAYEAMARAANPYGDGHASERIAARVLRWGAGRGASSS